MRDDATLPQHWHEHAEEARVIAETMSTPEARRVMLQVAEAYRRLARRAERGARKDKRSVFDGEEAA